MPNKVVKTISAHVPFTVAPAIDKQFYKYGIRFYQCGTRIFMADTYDKVFRPQKTDAKRADYRNKQIRGT